MKNRFKQGRSSKYILLTIMVILVSLSVFTLSACNKGLDVASIQVVEDSIPQNARVSEFDITTITLSVVDSQGLESTVAVTSTMLTTDSRNKIKTAGIHNITVMYQQKSTTFTVRLFEDDAELVTVTFKDRNNTIIATMVTVKGDGVQPPTHPLIEGMVADGWIDSSQNQVSFASVNESLEVKARYVKDVQTHTVTFKDHLGNVISTIQVEHGNRIPETPVYVEPEGIASWDWFYGGNKLDIEKLVVNQNLTISIRVETKKHTVEYQFKDINGDIVKLGQEQVVHNGSATGASSAIELLYSYGYNFVRWKTPFNNVKMDLVVEAEATIFSYQVQFFDYKGNVISTAIVNHGDDAPAPLNVTEKTGYIFNNEWSGSLLKVTSNLNLTAIYIPKSIEITLYDGASPEIINRDFGTVINADNLQQIKSKTGYILLGLYEDALLNQIVELPYTITSNTTLYTKWIDTVNGNSELMYNTYQNYKELNGYNGNDAIIYIPSRLDDIPITIIDSNVFKDKSILKVNFGSNIKEIKAGAFENTKLTGTLHLPAGLEKIGARAFAGCVDIEHIIIPDSVTEIHLSAFEGAVKLKTITISNSSNLTEISNSVFKGCSSLTSISLPDGIVTIGESAFEGAGLTGINLKNVETISQNAFKDCLALASISLNNAKTIMERAFANTALTILNLTNVETIESHAFENNKHLTTVTLGRTATIKANTFLNCAKLTNVNFVVINEDETEYGVSIIEDYAFINCNNLLAIELPRTLQSISAKAFSGALKLENITVDADNKHYYAENGILYDLNKTALIAYPAGKAAGELIVAEGLAIIKANAFENAVIAKLVLPITLARLEEKALYSRFILTIEFLGDLPDILDGETELDIISDHLWKLYVAAEFVNNYTDTAEFANAEQTPVPFIDGSLYCQQSGLVYTVNNNDITIVAANRLLTSITVPSSIGGKIVKFIAPYAFQNCDKLQTITIQANLFELGEYAFKGCTSLNTITFASIQRKESNSPGSIINLNAFYDTPWYIHNDLIVIADIAFEYKFALDSEGEIIEKTSLTIPSAVEVLSEDLFNNEAGRMLENVYLPQALEIIRARAFYGSNIKSIYIPIQVFSIEESAFENSAKLESINISRSALTSISARAFAGCSSLTEIELPLNITKIENEAFRDCTSLRTIQLPNALTKIGEYAFYGCISMPVINIPSRVGTGLAINERAIGDQAFRNCNSLVYVRMWNTVPPVIGNLVFDSGVYIYVDDSDGDIISNYQTAWSQYASRIKEQKNSPEVSFIINKDSKGNNIAALDGVVKNKVKTSVLYEAPTLPEIAGYLFVCWTYEESVNNWVPVQYPFLIPESTTLTAKWVRVDEGSMLIDDLDYNYSMSGYALTEYSGSDTKVVIPAEYRDNPIIIIDNEAFMNNTAITDIIFIEQSNIKHIRTRAFAGMTSLTRIVLPSSVLSIGNYAFDGCANLEYIFIPKSVESIGEFAFANCNNLNIVFEEGSKLKYAHINSFNNTLWYSQQKEDELSNFVIAGRLIIEYLKNENQNLVTLPIKAVALRQELFMNDSDLVTIEFHPYIEFIGDRAFLNCSSLINVDFATLQQSSSINYVGENAFANTPWSNAQDVFEQVGGVLIRYKGSDTVVHLPDTITAIEKEAFAYKAITSIRLSKNLRTIAERAFFSCNNLVTIEIPAQVTHIGKEAFSNNVNLKSVVFLGNNVVEIGEKAFFGCTSLGTDINVPTLTLPSSLTRLGVSAFEGCSALTNVNMTSTKITVLNNRVFFGANNLNTVSLPGTIVTIEDNAFKGCTVLENVTIAQNSALRQVSASAFADTAWYNKTDFDEDVLIFIGNVLLKYRHKTGNTISSDVVIPSHIKYIAPNAFENANIKSVTFPNELLEIGESAFAGSYITNLVIPDSVQKIGISAFARCANLTTVTLGNGLKELEAMAFYQCGQLTKVTVSRMSYTELSTTQLAQIRAAINDLTLDAWLASNNEIFIGTELFNINAFAMTPASLRIYVVRDSMDINKEIYVSKWTSLQNRIFNVGDLPTVDFVNVTGAQPIAPISTEYLTEQDLITTYKDHTLLGWEKVNSAEDDHGERVTLPLRVTENMMLRPIWLSNNRSSVNDSALGFIYSPNAAQNGYLINSYNSTSDTMVIPSKVLSHNLLGVNTNVFTEANTANVKTIMITNNDNLALVNHNIFNMFVNLERIIINGKNFASVAEYNNYNQPISSNYVTIDGVLYTKDLKTLVAYPRAKKVNGSAATTFDIPFGVETILAYAFKGSTLRSLNIPDTIMYIGEGAFDKNFALDAATGELTGLRFISFGPASEIREIAYGAFNETAWYKSLTSSFKVAGTYLLSYNGFNEEVVVPNTIKTIGIRAFENSLLNNITKLTIPINVIRINQDAFANCSNIRDIVFNAGSQLKYAANNVFADTSWISAMHLDANEFIVAGNILISYKGGRDYLPLPNEVKIIGYNAFNNASFTGITLHNNLERIDENAFFGCDKLESITIPASVKSIGNFAFFSCLELTEVTFAPNSNLTEIGASAFSYCSKLISIEIPDKVKTIGNSAFEYCNLMTTATISEDSQLLELGASAFKNARRLVSIHIPNGLTEIKTSTFEGCESLLRFTFSNSNRKLTKIGENAFKNCLSLGSDLQGRTNLLTVELPYNVNTIEAGAFYGCSSLYGIKMQGQIKSIGLNAFYNCSKLANVSISTSQPPQIVASSFNFSAHPKLRVYVNISPAQSVLNAYVIEWGGDKVASSSNIFERGNANLPLVQFYDYTAGGEEVHLANYDRRAELLSALLLPAIRHDTKGMAVGFFKNNNFDLASQICTATRPFEIVQDNVLKLYVRWENS